MELIAQPPKETIAEGCGPRAALKKLDLASKPPEEVGGWMERARMNAILGSCPGSIESVKSGIRCYLAFVSEGMCVCACCGGRALLVCML